MAIRSRRLQSLVQQLTPGDSIRERSHAPASRSGLQRTGGRAKPPARLPPGRQKPLRCCSEFSLRNAASEVLAGLSRAARDGNAAACITVENFEGAVGTFTARSSDGRHRSSAKGKKLKRFAYRNEWPTARGEKRPKNSPLRWSPCPPAADAFWSSPDNARHVFDALVPADYRVGSHAENEPVPEIARCSVWAFVGDAGRGRPGVP